MQVLRRLVRERGFEIFVHPPPTVLDETRYVHAIQNGAQSSVMCEAFLELG
jgi:hypothetical protein